MTEIEFKILAKDEATRVFSNVKAQAEQSFKAVQSSSNSATFAMMNFNRIVQDAPYGFIGIANNLNPMLESFQRLQKETGSTGLALKSMLGVLSGPAGLGIAIAAASSALVLFGNSSRDAKKSADDLNETLLNQKIRLGELTREQGVAKWTELLVASEVEMFRLKQATIDWGTTLKMIASGTPMVVYKNIGTPEDILKLQVKINDIKLNIQSLNNDALREYQKNLINTPKVVEENRKSLSELAAEFKNNLSPAFSEFIKLQKVLINTSGTPIGSGAIDVVLKQWQDREKAFKSYMNVAIQGIQLIGSYLKQSSDAQVAEVERDKKAELDSISQKLSAETISEQEKTGLLIKRTEIEREAEEQIKNIKRDQFEKERLSKTAEVAMNTALAIMEAAPNVPLMIAMGALGATQAAIVASQANPFHEGGIMGAGGNRISFDERPAILRVGETVRTKEQEQNIGRGGITIILNNANIADERAFKKIVEQGMRKAGVSNVSNYFKDQTSMIEVN